jgi:hypothetical protein
MERSKRVAEVRVPLPPPDLSERVLQEEKLMLAEVAQFGQLASYGSAAENPEKAAELLQAPEETGRSRANSTTQRGRANSLRSRANSMRDRSGSLAERARAGSFLPLPTGRERASTVSLRAVLEERDEEELTEEQRERRDELMRRVLLREQKEREEGVDEDTLQSQRKAKVEEEGRLLDEEIARNGGTVADPPTRRRAPTLHDAMYLSFTPENFRLGDPKIRPDTWTEIRGKRVNLKEHIDRINGIPEHDIVLLRSSREIDVRVLPPLPPSYCCLTDECSLSCRRRSPWWGRCFVTGGYLTWVSPARRCRWCRPRR